MLIIKEKLLKKNKKINDGGGAMGVTITVRSIIEKRGLRSLNSSGYLVSEVKTGLHQTGPLIAKNF